MIMTFYPTYIWACIASAIIGAAAAFLFFKLKGGSLGAKGEKTLEDMKDCDKKFIAIGLRDNAEYFADLYEPMYLLSTGKATRKDAIFDAWNTRAASSECSLEFKNSFQKEFGFVEKWKGNKKKYIAAAKDLVKYMDLAGIKRGEETAVTANEETAEKYELAGGAALENGATYDVLAPFWFNEAETLCKGVIR